MNKPHITKYENRAESDVDDTLVATGAFIPAEAVHSSPHKYCFIKSNLDISKNIHLVAPYYDGYKIIIPKLPVEAFIRSLKSRGYHITVQSNNGWQWAENVVKALEMEDCVDEIQTKASKCIDDAIDYSHICGTLIHPDILK